MKTVLLAIAGMILVANVADAKAGCGLMQKLAWEHANSMGPAQHDGPRRL
jgi:hypothetical protein